MNNQYNCQVVPNFEAIPLENMPPPLDEDQQKELSTDVKYLYQIANAVSNGRVSNINPDPVSHAR